jgi:hypothetical protein
MGQHSACHNVLGSRLEGDRISITQLLLHPTQGNLLNGPGDCLRTIPRHDVLGATHLRIHDGSPIEVCIPQQTSISQGLEGMVGLLDIIYRTQRSFTQPLRGMDSSNPPHMGMALLCGKRYFIPMTKQHNCRLYSHGSASKSEIAPGISLH